MNTKNILTLIGVVLIGVIAIVVVKASQIKFLMEQEFVQPPQVVTSADVLEGDWEEIVYAPGEIEAVKGVMVSAQLEGEVAEILFESGSVVTLGDVLVKQDITTELAQLESANSALSLADKSFARAKPLLASKDISQEDYDVFESEYLQAKAQVSSIETTIAKKNVAAPFDGQLGISAIDVGQYLSPGQQIVTLQDTSKILVNFSVPQRDANRIKIGQPVRIRSEINFDGVLIGEVKAVAPLADQFTRSVSIQAQVENPERFLKPGMFVDVDVVVSSSVPVKMIPVSAVLNATYGDTVFVIKSEGETLTIEQTFVRLGASQGDFISVEQGLDIGDRVVSSGLFKLFNGQSVVIDNSLAPTFELNPDLSDS